MPARRSRRAPSSTVKPAAKDAAGEVRPIMVTATRTTHIFDGGIVGAVATLILRKRNG